MVKPHTVVESVKTAVKQSGRLPDSTSYATFELDEDGGQANVRPPAIEITMPTTVRSTPNNTDFYKYATDDNGNHIGYIYRARFEMTVELDVWTAEGDGFDPDTIGREVRNALYEYDSRQLGRELPDPSAPSNKLSSISHLEVGDGEVRNDLSMTPALRRWRQTLTVNFYEEVNTADEYGSENYVTNVITPKSGDMKSGSSVEIIYDATPNTESAADQY